MSILLGTNTLPTLFAASVVSSMLAQPVASQVLLSTTGSRSNGVSRVFQIVSIVLFGFALAASASPILTRVPFSRPAHHPAVIALHSAASADASHSTPRALTSSSTRPCCWKRALATFHLLGDHEEIALSSSQDDWATLDRHLTSRVHRAAESDRHLTSRVHRAAESDAQLPAPQYDPATQQAAATSGHDESDDGDTAGFTVADGDQALPLAKRTFFVIFYLWMGTHNLVCTSVLWARCSDIFPEAGARRVFGVLAAAATAGQLAGASVAGVLGRQFTTVLPVGALPHTVLPVMFGKPLLNNVLALSLIHI